MCVVLNIKPLAVVATKLTRFLDNEGILSRSIQVEELEEGEIPHGLTIEELADMFKMSSDDVSYDPEAYELPEEQDEVLIENAYSENYPTYQTNDDQDLPNFPDLSKINEEDLKQKVEEKIGEEGASVQNDEELKKLREAWLEYVKKKKNEPQTEEMKRYTRFYDMKGTQASGKIISWAFLDDLQVYAVKRERGIEYFKHAPHLKSLPYFDMHQLARLKLLYSDTDDMATYAEKKIKFEFKHGWNLFKPQWPKILRHLTKKHPITGHPSKINKYGPPSTMQKVPIRKLRKGLSEKFRFWYYDRQTTEAVIVVGDDDQWESIRVFDPMWLRNLSKDDIRTLCCFPMFFDVQDMDQAMLFVNVVRTCYLLDIHGKSKQD